MYYMMYMILPFPSGFGRTSPQGRRTGSPQWLHLLLRCKDATNAIVYIPLGHDIQFLWCPEDKL